MHIGPSMLDELFAALCDKAVGILRSDACLLYFFAGVDLHKEARALPWRAIASARARAISADPRSQ